MKPKRKDMPEKYRPLYGKTIDEARVFINVNNIVNRHGLRITQVRPILPGEFKTLVYEPFVLSVGLDADGRVESAREEA